MPKLHPKHEQYLKDLIQDARDNAEDMYDMNYTYTPDQLNELCDQLVALMALLKTADRDEEIITAEITPDMIGYLRSDDD